MIIKSLTAENFRNIHSARLEFSDSVTVICGDNAEGKTNFLESLWLFTGNRSFRASHDSDLVNFKAGSAQLHLDFFKNGRNQYADIDIKNSRKYSLNGVELKSGSDMMSDMNMILFLPTHLSLIKDGPSVRREFIDTAISVIKPDYRNNLRIYGKILKERNALLHEIPNNAELLQMLDIYDSQLSRVGSSIIKLRIKYLSKLSEYTEQFYNGISSGKEKLTVKYAPSVGENFEPEDIVRALKDSRNQDLIKGITTVGAHRDDFITSISDHPARDFASQGQQRSAVLCFKLAESEIQNEVFKERPVVLLDDVMSELDRGRQEYLYSSIGGSQIFITYCEKSEAMRISPARLYFIRSGEVIEK